ncbi:Glutathione S-transferase F12 [Vitis vinifera]|uniref:glutathione transferase n=1 Tax=Vitis vinifera TaxID=29760 RepID=A0A438FM31_VITVI|nr:Glutathione S-transferase F12 [Vitis vinifera]
MVVKVYGAVMTACPQRVLACLVEKGLEFEVVHVDLDFGEQKRPEFLIRQPFGQVRVMEDGDIRLFDRSIIIYNQLYIVAKYVDESPNLVGRNLEERSLVDQWLEVEENNLNPLIFTVVLQLVILPRMGEKGDLTLVRNCEQKLDQVFDAYEYLVNEAGIGHLITERKNVSAWWENISNMPAWKKVMNLAS